MTVDIEKLEALAKAFPDLDFDSGTEPFFNGPSGESLGGGSTGFYCVYGKPFEIDGDQYDGNEYVSTCTKKFAQFMCTAKHSVLELIAGHIIAHHNATAVYRTVGGLLQYIKGSYGDRAEYSEKEAFASLIDPSLLIIDEVGATKPTEFELATLFAVINGRYEEQLPTIVISNIDAKELGAVLGDRSVDRLREGRGIGLVFEGASERSKRRAS
ncbi:ATP-binding protein [Pseudomonas syringae]|uniref:ATP-binding protein n=1 Tax=Pseudomonas syringae TaxID=317 RepID=UPI001F28D751|nr:ATP-binding protein [Pseudomonas syringae]